MPLVVDTVKRFVNLLLVRSFRSLLGTLSLEKRALVQANSALRDQVVERDAEIESLRAEVDGLRAAVRKRDWDVRHAENDTGAANAKVEAGRVQLDSERARAAAEIRRLKLEVERLNRNPGGKMEEASEGMGKRLRVEEATGRRAIAGRAASV